MKMPAPPLQMLVIGDVERWLADGRNLPRLSQLRFAELADLDSALLEQIGPDMVLAPLLAVGFDVLDVALRLHDLGFGGRLRAISPLLPNPGVVTREVAHLCPGLDFELLEIDPATQPLSSLRRPGRLE